MGSPSRGGDVAVSVFDINQPSLPTPWYSVRVSFSVFVALSTVFHSINSPDNSPLSHSVLAVAFLPCWSFQLYISSTYSLLKFLWSSLVASFSSVLFSASFFFLLLSVFLLLPDEDNKCRKRSFIFLSVCRPLVSTFSKFFSSRVCLTSSYSLFLIYLFVKVSLSQLWLTGLKAPTN